MPQTEAQVLAIAEGTIDPQARIEKGEITEDTVNAFAEVLLTDEFYDQLDGLTIPTVCVDGRPQSDGQQKTGYNAAGGSFSLVMGDALTFNDYRQSGDKAPDHAKKLYAQVTANGHEIGGHTDNKAHGPNCGCGAQDKLDAPAGQPSILEFMGRSGNQLRAIGEAFGLEISDEHHDLIMGNVAALRNEQYATIGADLRDSISGINPTGNEELADTHNEVAVVINKRLNQTLDRQKVCNVYGDKYQAFNVDVPALDYAADVTSLNPNEKTARLIAMVYYNVATASVLAGPSLRVVVRD